MIGQKQQDTFKSYDDFIRSTANGGRLAESCGQDMVDTTQGTRSKLQRYTPIKITGKKPINIILICFHYYGCLILKF